MSAECGTCRMPIDWATTEAGRPMPVDRDSADQPGGNLAVWRDTEGVLRCRSLKAGDQALSQDEHLGMCHWQSCPQADQHRRRT